MNKKFAAIGIATLVLASCMTSAQARVIGDPPIRPGMISTSSKNDAFIQKIVVETQLSARALTLSKNTKDLHNAINDLKQHVGKTWYVFSGSTPRGWDCSGLVLWTYQHLGFDLEHRATAQIESGRIVNKPKYGDLVGFRYTGGSKYYHVGIYLGNDLMLHSGGKPGDKTEVRSISGFAGKNSTVHYSRLIDTN